MKTKIRRILSVILTLCMVFSMVPGRAVIAEAAEETYSIWVDFPYNSNDLLPNSTKEADVYLDVTYPDGGGARVSEYTIDIASIEKATDGDPEPSQLLNVQIQKNNRMIMTANASGVTGSCAVTLNAKVNGTVVATNSFIINVKNEIYEIPDVLVDSNNNVVNPELGAELDLERLLVLKKLTYNSDNKSITSETMNLSASKYTVTINYPTDRWTKTDVNDTTGAYNLTRITAENAWINVSIVEENVGCRASNNYEFEPLDYAVNWERNNVVFEVYKDGTANFNLNTESLRGKDYTVAYTLGYGPWSQNNVLSSQDAPLYTSLTDGEGKVIGIRVDGAAISQVRQGNDFWIKAETSVIISGTPYKVSEDYIELQLLEPNYSVCFQSESPTVSNTETARELYLDTRNIQNKAYDINFTLGNFNPVDGFVSYDTTIQDKLYTKITDANNDNKVIGICLNGAAISSVCNNSQFEIKTEVIINKEVKYTYTKSVELNRSSYFVDIIWNGSWPIRVFDDATAAQIMLDTNSLSNLPDYELDFELGTMGPTGPNSYAPFNTQTGLFDKVVDSNTGKVTGIILNGVAIRQVCSSDEFVIKVDIKLDGYSICTNHLGVCLFSTEPSYHYYYGSENVLPGEAWRIAPQIEYEIQNSQNPDGILGMVDVTDVSVQVTDGAPDAVIVEKDGDMWNIICNGLGEADVIITHKTPDGGTQSYTYTISGVDSIWKTGYWNREGLYNAVQGGSIRLDLTVDNVRWSQNVGEYKTDSPYEIEWYVMDPNKAQYVNFVPNNADGTDVTIEVASNAPEEDYDFGYFVYEVDDNGNRVTDNDGNAYPVCGSGGRLVVMNDFPYLKLKGYTRDLEVGESITVTPSAIRRYLDNGVVKEENIAAPSYNFWNDPESVEIVDNQDGTFTITRLNDCEIDNCGIGVEATYMGEPFRTDEWMYFPEVNYSVSYNSLRGQNYNTWLYANEVYTLELDTTNLDDKRMDATIDWMVVKWLEDGDFEEITSGYAVEGAIITLDGAALAALGVEEFGVAGMVVSNGYATSYGAYADVELMAAPAADSIDTSKPVEAVTPVVSQSAVDTAVKEAMTVVETMNTAVMENPELLNEDGTEFTALPEDLEGVVSLYTLNTLLEAVAEDKDITIHVEAELLTAEAQKTEEVKKDIQKIEAKAPGEIKQYFDLSVYYKIDGILDKANTLNKVENGLVFTVVLPDELKSVDAGRLFVMYMHDGKTEADLIDSDKLTKNTDDTISFNASEFSTYALGVKPEIAQPEEDNSTSEDVAETTTTIPESNTTITSPATGDVANLSMWLLTIIVMVCLAFTCIKRYVCA